MIAIICVHSDRPGHLSSPAGRNNVAIYFKTTFPSCQHVAPPSLKRATLISPSPRGQLASGLPNPSCHCMQLVRPARLLCARNGPGSLVRKCETRTTNPPTGASCPYRNLGLSTPQAHTHRCHYIRIPLPSLHKQTAQLSTIKRAQKHSSGSAHFLAFNFVANKRCIVQL